MVLLSPGRARFAQRDILPIALLGITQFGILIALLNYGLRFIPSGRAALIFATFPLLTLVLAAALGHERLTVPKILGVLLTIAGVGLALGEKVIQGGGTHEWVGELAKDGRILRKRAGAKRPLNSNVPPKPTLKKSDLPGRAPLPQQMGEFGYDTIDVLEEDPEVFKRLSDRRADMD